MYKYVYSDHFCSFLTDYTWFSVPVALIMGLLHNSILLTGKPHSSPYVKHICI